jgi:hypothetical protein
VCVCVCVCVCVVHLYYCTSALYMTCAMYVNKQARLYGIGCA